MLFNSNHLNNNHQLFKVLSAFFMAIIQVLSKDRKAKAWPFDSVEIHENKQAHGLEYN